MIKLSFFLISAFFSITSADLERNDSCDEIVVELNIKLLKDESSKITLDVQNAKKPLKYIFLSEAKDLLSREFEEKSIILDKKGTYYYAVLDANGCKVTSKFKIE